MSSRSNTRAFPEALAPLAAPGVHRSTRAAVSAVRDRGARGDAASLASPPDPPSVEDHLLLDSGMTPEPIKVRFGQGLFDSWQSFPEELLPSGSSSVRMPSSLEEAAMFRRSQPHGSAGWNIPPGVENAPTAARAARLCELAKAPLLNPVDSPGATDLPPTADAPAWAKDHRRFASAQDVYAHLGEIDLGGALVIVRFCLGGPESPPAHGHDSDAASEDMLRFSPPVLLVVGSLGTPFLSDPGYNFADHFTAQGIEVFLPSMIPVATDMSPMIASLDATLQDVTPSRLSDVLLSERAAATLFWQKGIKLCAPFQSPVTLDDNVPQDSAWFPLMASLQESRELLTSHEVPLVLSARPLSEANRTPGAWQFCRAFPLPRDHGLPTGLAVELSADLSLAQFRSVVAAHQHQSTLEETAWLDSPWAEAWFASVANQPDFFITDVCQFPLVQDTLKPLLSGPYDSPALARAWPAMFLQLKADISFCRVIKNGFSFRPGTQNDQAVQNWITRYTRFLENCDTVMTANARCFSELRPMPPYARNPFAQMLLRPETRAWLERFDVRSVVAHLDSDSWALRSYEPIIVPVDSTYAPDSIPTFHLARSFRSC